MSFVYNTIKDDIADGLALSTADLRVSLHMALTTLDTEDDVDLYSGFTTTDECDGASYARVDLAAVVSTRDDPNDYTYIDANDAVFTTLGAGTSANAGAFLHIHNATPGLEVPVAWIDTGGFPFQGTGSNNTIQWNAAGIIQFT